jgi:apolipoprotein N-acyltransferase
MRARLFDLVSVVATGVAMSLCSRMEMPWFWLGWVMLVPWLFALDRQTTWRGVCAIGLLQCIAFTVGVFAWFAPAIARYASAPTWLAFAVLVATAPLLQPQMVVSAMARHYARRLGRPAAAICCASSYVGFEWMYGKLFADTLGHGFYSSPIMRQAADLAGAYGLTVVFILANECARVALDPARWRDRRDTAVAALALFLSIPVVVASYGSLRLHELAVDEEPAVPVKAALVQTGIAEYDRLRREIGTYETVRMVLDAHLALTRDALDEGAVDLVLWAETVYPTTFGKPRSEDGAAFDHEIADFVRSVGVPLVFGSYDNDGVRDYNAAIVLERESDGGVSYDAYRKSRLFLLTERVPWYLDNSFFRGLMPWMGTWKPGAGAAVMSVGLPDGRRVRLAPLICLDAVDPSLAIRAVRDGATTLVVMSNDAWFAGGSGALLHLVVSAFRSIETRRPQLRVTTTGISAVITPTGEMIGTLGVGERKALVASIVPVAERSTLMLAWGDWLGPTSTVLTAALLVLAALARRRSIK